jgi:hypothetical protein
MSVAGLDTSQYPTDEVMTALITTTNVCFTGYYLAPAPSHHDTSWMGKRAWLESQGWGFCPTYLGQQVTGPGSHIVTQAQGTIDGEQAASLMAQEGFAKGSTVFLDLENGPPMNAAQEAYVGAWADAVVGAGYVAGVYCSHLLAVQVAGLALGIKIWVFDVGQIGGDANFPFPTPPMTDSGYPDAVCWQRADNVNISCQGHSLLVDLDVANVKDPSAPILDAEGNPLA